MSHHKLSGSKIVFLTVSALDTVLAVAVLLLIEASGMLEMPRAIEGDTDGNVLTAIAAALVGMMFYGNIIYRQRLSAWDVVARGFRFTLVQSLALMLIVRARVGVPQGVMRLAAAYFALYFLLLLISRVIERRALNHLRSLGHNRRSVVLIGSDESMLTVYSDMCESAAMAYNVLGYYADSRAPGDGPQTLPATLTRLGTTDMLLADIESGGTPFLADEAYMSVTGTEQAALINTLTNYCDRHLTHFFLVPRLFQRFSMTFLPVRFGDITLLTNRTNDINRLDNRIAKRLFDIAFSSVVCLLLLPLLPLIWIVVRVQSPGPLFFAQERTGLNGETFRLYKFRSMHVNADADKRQATAGDPRLFPFGAFMRRTNIDELPQFYNVLRGTMSVVGPRPHMLYHTRMYSEVIQKYMARHFSKPGITGWAQVTGYRGETRELWQMEERVKRDIWYNDNWSFALDMRIILRTMLQTFRHDANAY